MNKSKFVALLIGLAVNSSALAEGGSFYFGASAGKAEGKEDACPSDPGFTCDRKGRGSGSGFIGLMVNKYFGIEGGAHLLGTVAEAVNATTGESRSMRVKLGELVGIAAFPIGPVAIYAKGGGYYAKSENNGTVPSESTNKQWTYGAGVSWDVFTHAGVRLEWQRFNNVGGTEIGVRTDVDRMSVGAYLKF